MSGALVSDVTARPTPGAPFDALVPVMINALQNVFGDALGAVLTKGSAVRAGGADYIPYYSDFDCNVFLAHDVMRYRRTPRLEFCTGLARELRDVDPEAWGLSGIQFSYLDVEGFPFANLPMPGVYKVVHGELPDPFEPATDAEQIRRGWAWFEEVPKAFVRIHQGLPGASLESLRQLARNAGSTLRATLCSAATIATEQPRAVWLSAVDDVVAIADDVHLPVAGAREFFADVRDWPARRHEPDALWGLTEQAVQATEKLLGWFAATHPDHAPTHR